MTNKDKAERIFDTVLPRQWTKNDWIPALAAELDRIDSEEQDAIVKDFRMDELDAVMHSVDKWFDEDDPRLGNNPATRAADAREIALRAIECEQRAIEKVCKKAVIPVTLVQQKPPMTDSELVQEVRCQIARVRSDDGIMRNHETETIALCNLSSRLCDEFEPAIKRALAAAETVQMLTKRREKHEKIEASMLAALKAVDEHRGYEWLEMGSQKERGIASAVRDAIAVSAESHP